MSFEIVLTTAEDIVAVVDAVFARSVECNKKFICEFTELTENRAENALHMAEQLALIKHDSSNLIFIGNSFLARLMISSKKDEHKASIMRLILEQYEPFIVFKSRFIFTNSADSASKQIKILYQMRTQYKDIKNTIVSLATYSKAMIDEGANIYKLNSDTESNVSILGEILRSKSSDENILISNWGNDIYEKLDRENIIKPLTDAFSKIQNSVIDTKSVILYAASAFESFLVQLSNMKKISLENKNGIISKANTLELSKKHKGMVEYVGQVRNAADHGADTNENGNTWEISIETAKVYPFIVTNLIKTILLRESDIFYV